MEEKEKTFGIMFSNSGCKFIPNGIICVQQEAMVFFCIWNFNFETILLYSCNANGRKITKSFLTEQLILDKEELTFRHTVVNVLSSQEFLYVVDLVGTVYQLQYKDIDAEMLNDSDIFELPANNVIKWSSRLLGIMEKCDRLINILATENELVSVVDRSNNLFANVYRIDNFQFLFSVQFSTDMPTQVSLSYINLPLSQELKNVYFPFINENDCKIILIGLPSGKALSFKLNESTDNLNEGNVVFSVSEPILAINYYYDSFLEICTSMVVMLSSGRVVIISGSGSYVINTSLLPNITFFSREYSTLLSSDGEDCVLTKIKFCNPTFYHQSNSVVIKGVRATCSLLSVPELIFISTQQCCIYWLDLSVGSHKKDSNLNFKEPVFNEFVAMSKQLSEIGDLIKQKDLLMSAVSIASMGKSIQDYFKISVRYYSEENVENIGRLELRLENCCDFACFQPDLWLLSTTVKSKDGTTKIFVNKLECSFTKSSPLTVVLKCSPNIEDELSCEMLAHVDKNVTVVTVLIGKVIIDALYFLTIIKDKIKFLTEVETTKHLVKGIQHDLACYNYILRKESIYAVKLDPALSQDKLFQLIFFNSSHRLSKNQWLKLRDSCMEVVNVAIGNQYWVELKFNKSSNSINIKSNDINACYFIKSALLLRLLSNNSVELEEDIYSESMNAIYSYELEKFKTNCDVEKIIELKNKFRDEIINKLPL